MKNCLVLFDSENQEEEISQFKNWEVAANFSFLDFTIKDEILSQNQDIDLSDIDLVIILIGESTRFLGNRFKAAVIEILKTDVSILCLNTNGFTALEEDICPRMLANAGCIHMPFTEQDLKLSLSYMKPNGRALQKTGSFHYKNYTPDPFEE